jgi:hypothetical protein
MESKYEQVSPVTEADQQSHLTASQRADLATLLAKSPQLFSGKLGLYPHRKVHLDVEPDAKPVYARPYSVAHNHRELFRQELDRLVGEGVLEPCGATEWASPTFTTPKKDGRVRWVSDSRELNKVIRHRVYLPRTQDQEIHTNRTCTTLDISIQLYPFELDKESRNLCAIITPFGKYRYCRLPMGVKVSPDVAQKIESPLATLETILTRHQDNDFTINPLQCEMGHPGNRLARPLAHSIGPQAVAQEDQAPLRLTPPIRQSVGAVTFFRDLFRRCSHVLAPLTALIGTKKFDWTPECDRAFNAMNALLSEDALLRYSHPNLPFHIYTLGRQRASTRLCHPLERRQGCLPFALRQSKRSSSRCTRRCERSAQFSLAPSSTCIPTTATYCSSP